MHKEILLQASFYTDYTNHVQIQGEKIITQNLCFNTLQVTAELYTEETLLSTYPSHFVSSKKYWSPCPV